MQKERLKWIDGLKGLACLLVFWHHFLVGFFPRMYYGSVVPAHLSVISEESLAQSPMLFFLNGNFMVAIFCAVSGVVVSLSIFKTDNDNIGKIIAKRYPRLMLPVIPIAFAVFLMLKYIHMYHIEISAVTGSPWLSGFYCDAIGIKQLLYSLFFGIWLHGDPLISNAYWVLNQLFLGTFVVIIMTLAVKRAKMLWAIVFLCFASFILLFMYNMMFVFPLSVLICYLYLNVQKAFNHPVIGAIFVPFGFFLGGYPSGIEHPTNIYRFLDSDILGAGTYTFWHVFGAVFLIYGFFNLKCIIKILENKVFLFLGKISYAIYLIHIPLLFSVGTYLFNIIYTRENYLRAVLILFVLINFIVVLSAFLYNRFVESGCERVTKKLNCFYKDM